MSGLKKETERNERGKRLSAVDSVRQRCLRQTNTLLETQKEAMKLLLSLLPSLIYGDRASRARYCQEIPQRVASLPSPLPIAINKTIRRHSLIVESDRNRFRHNIMQNISTEYSAETE